MVEFEPLVELENVESEMDQLWATVYQALNHVNSGGFEEHWDQFKLSNVVKCDLRGCWEAIWDRYGERKA